MDQASGLNCAWTIYESYFVSHRKDYAANLQKVVEIDSVEELLFVLNETVYSCLSNIFSFNHKIKV